MSESYSNELMADESQISDNSIRYITIENHRLFLRELDEELISLCNEDPILCTTVPLLQSCVGVGDSRLNLELSEYLDSKVEHHHGRVIKLTMKCFDGTEHDVFVLPECSVAKLKQSIERSIGLRVQMRNCQKDNNIITNKFRRIKWNDVWRKYDLWLDRTRRIPTLDTSSVQIESLHRDSTLEFIPKRRQKKNCGR